MSCASSKMLLSGPFKIELLASGWGILFSFVCLCLQTETSGFMVFDVFLVVGIWSQLLWLSIPCFGGYFPLWVLDTFIDYGISGAECFCELRVSQTNGDSLEERGEWGGGKDLGRLWFFIKMWDP